MRVALCALMLGVSAPALAADRSPPLSASDAKLLVSQFVMPGKVFAVRSGRYHVQSVDVSERAQTFTVKIKIQALEKVAQ